MIILRKRLQKLIKGFVKRATGTHQEKVKKALINLDLAHKKDLDEIREKINMIIKEMLKKEKLT